MYTTAVEVFIYSRLYNTFGLHFQISIILYTLVHRFKKYFVRLGLKGGPTETKSKTLKHSKKLFVLINHYVISTHKVQNIYQIILPVLFLFGTLRSMYE